MNEVDQYLRPLRNLAYWWRGRISRWQFWTYFTLWISLYTIIGVVSEKLRIGGGLVAIFLLLSIGPNYATAARRAHDRDRSGWFALMWFIPIVQLWVLLELGFLRGTIGDNQFGPEPIAGASFQWLRLPQKSAGKESPLMIKTKQLILYLGVILLFVAAYGDVTTFRISNLLVSAVALLGIIRLIMIGNIKIALYTVGVSFLVFIAGAVIFAHGFIGGGDVKLITAAALLIGYRDSIGFLLLLVICGAVQYVIIAGTAASATIPLGAAIAIAGSIMLFIRPTSNVACNSSVPT